MPLLTRTISIKIDPTEDQSRALRRTQVAYGEMCNLIVPHAVKHRCWNSVALHHHCYYQVRENSELKSQMTCQAIRQVAGAYKALKVGKSVDVPQIVFRSPAVRYDHHTYQIRGESVSMSTIDGRILVSMNLGQFQSDYLGLGKTREARLIRKHGRWFLNVILSIDSDAASPGGGVMGVDVGENNLATTCTGKIFKGGKLRHDRDKYLALRRRLQSNGSKSAKQLLKKVSGRERNHVRQVNHEVSKAIIREAIESGCGVIAMEDLTNIRKRIKASKRVRTRLHRWAWRQLQIFVEYKAEAAGIRFDYLNPAYTSQTCSICESIAQRKKHSLNCKNCGSQLHSDVNAALNLSRLGATAVASTGAVTHPNVASQAA